MNIVICTARLGKDAEVRRTQSGMAVCSFTGAVDSGYGDNKKTTWVNFVLFGKRAEGNLPQYLVKGAQIAVSGELSMDEWEKNGQKNKMLKCAVQSLDLIGDREERSAPAQSKPAPEPEEDFEDDIPF
jgi:single-strand DNA-binding protein